MIPTAPGISLWFRTGGRVLLEGQNWGRGEGWLKLEHSGSLPTAWDGELQTLTSSELKCGNLFSFRVEGLLRGQVDIPDILRLGAQILTSSSSVTDMNLSPGQVLSDQATVAVASCIVLMTWQ